MGCYTLLRMQCRPSTTATSVEHMRVHATLADQHAMAVKHIELHQHIMARLAQWTDMDHMAAPSQTPAARQHIHATSPAIVLQIIYCQLLPMTIWDMRLTCMPVYITYTVQWRRAHGVQMLPTHKMDSSANASQRHPEI